MGSENIGGDLTTDGYWGQLRAWGFSNFSRVTERSFTATSPDGTIVNVACPEPLAPEGRMAALSLICSVHLNGQMN